VYSTALVYRAKKWPNLVLFLSMQLKIRLLLILPLNLSNQLHT
jgi:hypothetical protein